MNNNIAIKVSNVSKTFRIPHEKISSVRGAFVNVFKMFYALKEISVKDVLNKDKNSAETAFFQILTGFTDFAIINLLKPPVLTARHGGVFI